MKKLVSLLLVLLMAVPASADITISDEGYKIYGSGFVREMEYQDYNFYLFYTEGCVAFLSTILPTSLDKEKLTIRKISKNVPIDVIIPGNNFKSDKLKRLFLETEVLNFGIIPGQFNVWRPKMFELPNIEHINFEQVRFIGAVAFKSSDHLDYACFGDNVYMGKEAFAECENLRTALFTDTVEYKNEKVFAGCPRLTIFGKCGTGAEDYARENNIPFIGSVISRGEPSTVVAKAEQNAAVTVNGTMLPAYTLNGSVYVSENALETVGFTTYWDDEARTTTVTAPENVQWSVALNTDPEPKTVDVVSTDIVFWYNGFRLPSLNIGNGESLVDVNALAEEVLYTIPTDVPAKDPMKVKVRIASEPTKVNGVMVDSEYRQYPLLYRDYILYVPLTYWDSRFLGIKAQWSESDHISVEAAESTAEYHDYLCNEKNPETDIAEKFNGTINYYGHEMDNTKRLNFPLLIYRDIIYIPYDGE